MPHIYLDPRVSRILRLLSIHNYPSYVVGGAVRDQLLGIGAKDWDIATPATPEEVIRVFKGHPEFKVYPTGIDHGTLSVSLQGLLVEITTFRKDMECDGRRASVEFSRSVQDDSRRRDLTINCLYADKDGNIKDPSGDGLEDIKNGLIRFVGDPNLRIQEDTLRILRTVRFSLNLGFSFDSLSLNALVNQPTTILMGLSIERIISELSRMDLSSTHNTGIYLLFRYLEPVFKSPLNNITYSNLHEFAGLEWFYFWLYSGVRWEWFIETPAISNKIKKRVVNLVNSKTDDDSWEIAHQNGIEETRELQEYLRMTLPEEEHSKPIFRELPEAILPVPVDGKDAMGLGYEGEEIGKFLKKCRKIWLGRGFNVSREELLSGECGD